jgi:CarD family transcriptional regulator
LRSDRSTVSLRPFPESTSRGAVTRTRTFAKGDKVVYPRHGVAVVEGLVDIVVLGERRACLKLRLVHGNLTITVPVASAEQVGLRSVTRKHEAESVFAVLRLEEGELPPLWNQRYKTNLSKLMTGDIHQGAEVIRDLSLRGRRTSLSSAERDMLSKARQILISELSCSFASTEESVQAMLDGVLEESI